MLSLDGLNKNFSTISRRPTCKRLTWASELLSAGAPSTLSLCTLFQRFPPSYSSVSVLHLLRLYLSHLSENGFWPWLSQMMLLLYKPELAQHQKTCVRYSELCCAQFSLHMFSKSTDLLIKMTMKCTISRIVFSCTLFKFLHCSFMLLPYTASVSFLF